MSETMFERERRVNEAPGKPENYLSVDIETWGPDPRYGIAAIGCVSLLTGSEFYAEAQPEHCASPGLCSRGQNVLHYREGEGLQGEGGYFHVDLESLAIHKLSPYDFEETPRYPHEEPLVKAFYDWVRLQPKRRVFASFSSFDWAFVYPALKRYLGESPFSHSSLEMKSFYMGCYGTRWDEAIKKTMAAANPHLFKDLPPHTHNALDDAKEQGELLRRMLRESRVRATAIGDAPLPVEAIEALETVRIQRERS